MSRPEKPAPGIYANDPFAGNSSNTYGLRATGMIPISDDLTASYEVSWAWQTDAATNPADYMALMTRAAS